MSLLEFPQPDKSLTEYIKYSSPIVYGWRRGDLYLYIGASINGTYRPFKGHHIINTREKLLPGDIIDIWCIPSEIYELEARLIKKFKPKYNVDNKVELTIDNLDFSILKNKKKEPEKKEKVLLSRTQYGKVRDNLMKDKNYLRYLKGEQ